MENIIVPIFEKEDIYKVKAAKATSVIIGSPFFSVRSCSYFTQEQLQEVVLLCKQQALQVYVLCNRFFMEEELVQLQVFLKQLKALCVDGIYFSDMAVYHQSCQLDIQHRLIYNPDTILTNSYDLQAYMDLGIQMCTISKEIPLDDIQKIMKQCHARVEVLVHGRTLQMHSKRNLLSNYMQFLKRDTSLKNNLQVYLKEENREEHMPIIEDAQGTHVFSGFSLCSFEEMDTLVQCGIHDFKIEGLFSTIDEVCQIVQDYVMVIENPQRGRELYQKYQNAFLEQNITKGFLYKKTGLLK